MGCRGDRSEAHRIEFPQRRLVHNSRPMEPEGGLVDRSQESVLSLSAVRRHLPSSIQS